MLRTLSTYLVAILIIVTTVLSINYYIYTKLSPNNDSRFFIVDKGSNLSQISYKLAKDNLITYPLIFKYNTIFLKKAFKIRAGEYQIPPHASMQQILKILTSGKLYEHKFVIPEGLTVQQIVNNLNNEPTLSGKIKLPLPSEGSLMATSLEYLRDTPRSAIIKRLQKGQKHLVEKIWQNRDQNLILKNSDELITLASIIEKETSVSKERFLIASVFYNRLSNNIRLQSDPTVVYGIYGGAGKPKTIPIYKSDLTSDNAYNTYKIFGLPKTPIANPGYNSLYAAAHPAKTSFLYFVSAGNGTHIFSETLEKHNIAVKNMREKQIQQQNQTIKNKVD